jgi:hypothetical protein
MLCQKQFQKQSGEFMKSQTVTKFPPTKPLPKPPKELGRSGRALWNQLQSEYHIHDSGGLASLLVVCRSEDSIQQMLQTVRTEGNAIRDRFGISQAHPLLSAIGRAEATRRQALRSLNLEVPSAKGVTSK